MNPSMNRSAATVVAFGLGLSVACAPAFRSTATGPMTPTLMAELWENPTDLAQRDLFWGPWGETLAPKPGQTYKVVEEKTTGFSPGFTVVDESGMEWSVKQGPEAHTEVAVSRILSAVGYHQPPVYYVDRWTQRGGPGDAEQRDGRFRPKDVGVRSKGDWSWQQNPFVGTEPYQGLLSLLMLLNGTDLKNDNNTLYEVDPEMRDGHGVKHWYVVRDVGAALGETGKIEPVRGDPFVFAKERFILGVKNGFVKFNYRGRHKELAERIRPSDLHWMANLVSGLTPAQWQDAFRAAGYGPTASDMFIARIKEKLEEIRRLPQDRTHTVAVR